MSNDKPILILQMQRMGDLVLTFPLMLWLMRRHPGRPLWVVAEPQFYKGLMTLSPQVVYFPWDGLDVLRGKSYALIVNLSHRARAAWLAGELDADEKIGPVRPKRGEATYILGDWQLYRASLVHNNRHNRYHWADLNALDLIPLREIATTTWVAPAPQQGGKGRVGLFLGASEEHKRPPASFWAALASELMRRNMKPVLLGGPDEIPLGREVAGMTDIPAAANLTGKFTVEGFTKALKGLSLLITPDTGPLHVASWTGTPTLDLSMGPVNPWETGPYPSGHHVLQAAMSCTGCWRSKFSPPRCRDRFAPGAAAFAAKRIVENATDDLAKATFPGLALFATGRDPDGLYALTRIDGRAAGPSTPSSAREAIALFWNIYFGARFGLWPMERPAACKQILDEAHAPLTPALLRALTTLSRGLTTALKRGRALESDFWSHHPPLVRPLSGFLQLSLQNSDYSAQGFASAVGMIEEIIDLGR